MNHEAIPDELLAKPSKPWITWLMVLALITGLVAWFGGNEMLIKGRSYMAHHYADKAEHFIEEKELSKAGAALTLARQWREDHPKFLRVYADFLMAINSDPSAILHTLKILEIGGQAHEEDYLRMAQIYIQEEQVENAVLMLNKLSPETLEKRPALEVLANIQRLRGETRQAEQTLRQALSLEPEDRMCRLRLALMDMQAVFSELRMEARNVLWNLARGQDRAALLAMETLSTDKDLTALEAEELWKLAEKYPELPETARFNVLSARMRVNPLLREDWLNAELAKYSDSGAEKMAPMLQWLLREKQPERVLAMQTGDLFTKSDLLIPHYLQALADLGRWGEIERILSRPAGMPISASFAALWRARAARNTDGEQLNTRQHLNVVYEASGHGRDGSTAKLAADIAEEAGLYDLAAKFYQGLSEYQPKVKIPMLEKVYEMAARSRDTDEVIRVAKQLLDLRPQNPQYIERLQYLQLVSGQEMEIQAAKILNSSSGQGRQDQLQRALAAYRLGDLTLMSKHLRGLADVSDFTPGQKAVHAGLLSISGQVGRAFQIAEGISTLLLLKEELRFLERAL